MCYALYAKDRGRGCEQPYDLPQKSILTGTSGITEMRSYAHRWQMSDVRHAGSDDISPTSLSICYRNKAVMSTLGIRELKLSGGSTQRSITNFRIVRHLHASYPRIV